MARFALLRVTRF